MRNSKKKLRLNANISTAHPLDAIPITAEGVEYIEGESGNISLRKKIEIRKGFFASLVKMLKLKRYKIVDLDQNGTCYWRLIDGKRSLRNISSTMALQCNVDAKEMERAVMLYTKALMLRGFVALKIEEAKSA